ncbi:MAG: hypothetical protein WC617_06640 [Rhodanobacter sp.]
MSTFTGRPSAEKKPRRFVSTQLVLDERLRIFLCGRATSHRPWRRDDALLRLQPIAMTVVVAIISGLLSVMPGAGTGSEMMRRIAEPMVGSMIGSLPLTMPSSMVM